MNFLNCRLFAALVLLAGLAVAALPGSARAAESYDACAGFIDSLPATISTQGVWCLRKNLSTSITSGDAITVATNNVTIDCNNFKIGGLAAGSGSNAVGIRVDNRQNATVRHCNVRGFLSGIYLTGDGHLVEGNRLDNNLYAGIRVTGDNNVVQRNRVYDTGGGGHTAYGIDAAADIIDNKVSGLFARSLGGALTGIQASGQGLNIRNNTVSGIDMFAAEGGDVEVVRGIALNGVMMRAYGNHVAGDVRLIFNGVGIFANEYNRNFCMENTVDGFGVAISPTCRSLNNLTAQPE